MAGGGGDEGGVGKDQRRRAGRGRGGLSKACKKEEGIHKISDCLYNTFYVSEFLTGQRLGRGVRKQGGGERRSRVSGGEGGDARGRVITRKEESAGKARVGHGGNG